MLGHLLRPYLGLLIVTEVAAFVATLGVLARLAWTGRALAPVWRTTRKADA